VHDPGLTITVRGPRVEPGRLAVRDLATIGQALERATVRAAEVILEERTRGRGRKPKAIEERCRLFLVGWGAGSVVARFELGRQGELFDEVGKAALGAVFDGLDVLHPDSKPGKKASAASMAALRQFILLRPLFDRGIDVLELTTVDGTERRAIFDHRSAEAVVTFCEPVSSSFRSSVVGWLERLDAHEELAGTLWDDEGTAWRCLFPVELEPELRYLWRRRVEVEGTFEPARGREKRGPIRVARVRAVEGPLDEATRRFREGRTLSELAREQGVEPIADPRELDSIWGADELETDPFEEIMDERRRRRLAASAG
jgi:hypothetical protein